LFSPSFEFRQKHNKRKSCPRLFGNFFEKNFFSKEFFYQMLREKKNQGKINFQDDGQTKSSSLENGKKDWTYSSK